MARIVTLGSALQDLYLLDKEDLTETRIGDVGIFGKIILGTKIDIDKISHEVGGGGVNAAVTIGRHGHETYLFSNVGRDPSGKEIFETLSRCGVNTDYINILPRQTTGTSIILLDPKSGERTILTCRGASEKFSNLDEKLLEDILPDYLYCTTLRGDMETMERFFNKATNLKTKIMLNPGVLELKQPEKMRRILQYVDILLVNRREAMEMVTGVTMEELIDHLSIMARMVIITDGATGGMMCDGKRFYRFGLYDDVSTKDMTGAGDAFGSGFLAEYARSGSIKSAITFASANATAVVTKIGANRGALDNKVSLHSMLIDKL